MPTEVPLGPVPQADGYAGSLTPDQTRKLRAFWDGYFEWVAKAHGHDTPRSAPAGSAAAVPDDPQSAPKGEAAKEEATIQEEQANLDALLNSYGPDALKRGLWEFVKMDNPDAICLRFLRARKWDVTRALGMFAGCLKWRLDNGVQELVEGGDLTNGANIEKFLDQQRSGKTYASGSAGGPGVAPVPVCYIHVKKHFTNGQPPSSMEKFVIYSMETFRCLMQPPGDKSIMFFDLGGFGIKNMDWHCILFIVKCLEAFYPESLAVLYVHNAPWVFSGIWKVLSPMLDPTVRSKIQFTKSAKDVQANVPADHMIASLGGNNTNEFKFVEPQPGENDKQKDTATRNRVIQRYHHLADAYEAATKRWIQTDGQDPSVEEERNLLFKKLRVAQFDLEPYTRGLTVYHRSGVVDGQGVTRWTYVTNGQTLVHVIGRSSCAAALRREIYEIEMNGKSSSQVESETEAAEKRRDWIALYGDAKSAAQVEGESEVGAGQGVLSGVQYDFTAPLGTTQSQALARTKAPENDSTDGRAAGGAAAGAGAGAGAAAGLAGIGAAQSANGSGSADQSGKDASAQNAYTEQGTSGEMAPVPGPQGDRPRWQPGKYKYIDLGGPSAKEVESRAFDLPEGTAKTLTPDQQAKLREMWAMYLSWMDKAGDMGTSGTSTASQAGLDPKKAKSDADKEAQRIAEEQAQLEELLRTHGPDAFRKAAWQFLDFDDPDGALLRFLRARKWDVTRAMNMCGATLHWRLENKVEDLVAAGELGNGKEIPKFLDQQRENKTFACGTALNEQPICAILVKKHFTNGQPASSMEKFVIFAMESFRLLMQPPQEKVVIIFSLEGFGIKNMDWNCILFIVKCLEAFYPESLGAIYLYAAPWVFSGVWKALSPLLDPVVRSKIVFVKSARDFADRIPPERLIEEVGGKAVDSFNFIEPVEGENDIQLNTSEKDKYIAAYMHLAGQFEDATRRWIESDGKDPEVNRERALLKRKLRIAAFDKMPYVRGKTVYHRQGTVDGMGRVTWVYKTKDGELFRHVIGRRDHYATLLREVAELESGVPLADVESKTEAAIARRDWLTLYGDAYAAHEIEGVPLDRATAAAQSSSAPPGAASTPARNQQQQQSTTQKHGQQSGTAGLAAGALAGSAAAGGAGYATGDALGSDARGRRDWTDNLDARSVSPSSEAQEPSSGTAPTEAALTDRSTPPPKIEKARSAPTLTSKPVTPAAGGLGRFGTHENEDGYTSSEDMFFDATEAHADDLARARAYAPPGHVGASSGQGKSKRGHRDRRNRQPSTRGPGVFADDAAAASIGDNEDISRISASGRRSTGRRSGDRRSSGGISMGQLSSGGRSGGGRSTGGRSAGGRSTGEARAAAGYAGRPAPSMMFGGSASRRGSLPHGGYAGYDGYDDGYGDGARSSYATYSGPMRVTGGSAGLGSSPGSAVQLYGGSYHYGPGSYGRGSDPASEDLALLYPNTSRRQRRQSLRGTFRQKAQSLLVPMSSQASSSSPALSGGGYDDFNPALPQQKKSLGRRLSGVLRH